MVYLCNKIYYTVKKNEENIYVLIWANLSDTVSEQN